MVIGVDPDHLTAHDLRDIGIRPHPYLVARLPLGRSLAVLEHAPIPLRRKVLVQRPAKRHVEHLHTTAYPEDRNAPPQGQPDERHLEGVALGERRAELERWLLPVISRVEITPPAQ